MPREVDPKRTRKALRTVRKLKAQAPEGDPLSGWETAFLDGLEERLDTYGSAFADPSKGGRDEALSSLQTQKIREIARKAKGGKPLGGFRRRPAKPPHDEV